MKDLKYISMQGREGILETYRNKWNLSDSDDSLESQIFGYPVLRRMVDDGIERADEQVDLERYTQWSAPWFQDVIKFLPEPWNLDQYKGTPVEEAKPEILEKKKVKDYIQTIEGYKQFRDKVDEILLHFDFEKVASVMEFLNWKWASWEDEEGDEHYNEVPTAFALRQVAYKLLVDAVERGMGGSGGFNVKCYVYDLVDENGVPYDPDEPDDFEHSVCLDLSFTVESWGDNY